MLASLPPSVASSLTEKRTDFVDPVYGYDFRFDGYSLAPVDAAEKMQAKAIVLAACRRCDSKTIASELTRMRVLTKARELSNDDASATVAAYAEELSRYPADIVRAACRGWSKREPWWPSWAELKEELTRHARRRKALAEVLR